MGLTMAACLGLLLLFTVQVARRESCAALLRVGPDTWELAWGWRGTWDGMGRPRSEWHSRRGRSRAENVGSDRRGLVVGFRSRTKTARVWWWVLSVDESRARAGEGQQGRMLRKGQVQIGSQKYKFGLGAS